MQWPGGGNRLRLEGAFTALFVAALVAAARAGLQTVARAIRLRHSCSKVRVTGS
jgi:hypothetical protein